MKTLVKELKTPNTTIRGWIEYFAISFKRGARGKYLIPPESVDILKEIKTLKAKGLDLAAIKRQLSGELTADSSPLDGEFETVDAEFSVVSDKGASLNKAVQLAVIEHSNMAEKLLMVGERAGYLKAVNENLENEVANLSRRIDDQATDIERVSGLEAARESLERDLRSSKAECLRLSGELTASNKKNAQLSKESQAQSEKIHSLEAELKKIKESFWFRLIR